MHSVPHTQARTHFAALLDKVNDDHALVLITRRKGKTAVPMSLDYFSA